MMRAMLINRIRVKIINLPANFNICICVQQPFKYNPSVRNPSMAGYPQPGQTQPQQQNEQQAIQQAVHVQGQEPLTATMLAAAQPQEQKQMLGKFDCSST